MCIHVALFCFVVAIVVVYLVFVFFFRIFHGVVLVILTPFVAKTGPKKCITYSIIFVITHTNLFKGINSQESKITPALVSIFCIYIYLFLCFLLGPVKQRGQTIRPKGIIRAW